MRLNVSGFKQGDTIGCGLILSEKKIFYTLNGVNIGVAISGIDLGVDLKEITKSYDQMELRIK